MIVISVVEIGNPADCNPEAANGSQLLARDGSVSSTVLPKGFIKSQFGCIRSWLLLRLHPRDAGRARCARRLYSPLYGR
jgi:hypothetical protein